MDAWTARAGTDIRGLFEGKSDFVVTHRPLSDREIAQAGQTSIVQIPTAIAAIVPTYSIPNVTLPLRFTPDTLAGIFLGEITWWNDARLAMDNPDAGLPRKGILVVHRGDESGTTAVWTDYLSSVSPEWKQTVGAGASVDWPVGLGARGSAGLAGMVKTTPYAIGYLPWGSAIQNTLPVGLVKNRAGVFLAPSPAALSDAAASAARIMARDLRASIVNAPDEKAYPICGFAWFLIRGDMKDQAGAKALQRQLWWALHQGQMLIPQMGYGPLPKSVVKRVEESIRSITPARL